MTIPAVVHTIWLGPQSMPDLHRRLFTANQAATKATGLEFRLWDDAASLALSTRFPRARRFLKYAIARRRWAFAADCVKAMILVQHGGWVLDADNEIVGDLRTYESHRWVSGFEAWGGAVHPITAAMGAIPAHPFSYRLLSAYATEPAEAMASVPNTRWISDLLWKYGMNSDDREQYLQDLDVHILRSDVFCGPTRTARSVVLHHFAGSWL